MRNTRLPGHGLYAEGKAVVPDPGLAALEGADYAYQLTGEKTGCGMCVCGEQSSVLPSDSQRRAWHAEHKAEVRRQQESGNG